jgi:hypothetical protein
MIIALGSSPFTPPPDAETQFGSIGIRVEPWRLFRLGGEILADGGRRGNAKIAIDQECQMVH